VKIKKVVLLILGATTVCVVLATGIYHVATRDPVPIKVDPKLYDDYSGYYDYGHGFIITIRRDGDRLMSHAPERMFGELLPETENRFFVKGQPVRVTFHRDENGGVDYAITRWKNREEKAERIPALPPVPAFTNGMVAATTGGVAVQAGLEILKEGGTAVDAAMATALCEVTQAGGSYVSFAGLMMMVYYDAASDRVYFLDAQFQTPWEEKSPRSIPRTGGRTALVPGFMAGVQAAHDRFGKVPFRRLFEPAIALAEKGETVSTVMAWWINSKRSVLSRLPETKNIFTKADGKFYTTGDLFRQPELARTLKQVASQGAAHMYEGDWARRFVEVIQKNGGRITRQDMTNYHARWEEPLQTNYREYQAYAPGLSTWGGVNNIEALNLLELANVKQSGPYMTAPQSLLWLMQIAECHKMTWTRHDLSEHDLSPKSRATKPTSAWVWEQMQNGKWPWLPEGVRRRANQANHSDGIVVVDQWGNMAVIGHTINTSLWGDTGIFVDGISIPDAASFQPRDIAQAGPGKRLPNGMNPTLILRDGKPFLGSSAVGGGLHYKTLQVLVNILDFDMDPQSAVDTPAFLPDGVQDGSFDPKVLEGVAELGMKVRVLSPKKLRPGYWVGVQVDPKNRRLRGGVSRGLEGQVAGY
jgi:gamma-glutamyltranspeptidase/glutathione hydrolase